MKLVSLLSALGAVSAAALLTPSAAAQTPPEEKEPSLDNELPEPGPEPAPGEAEPEPPPAEPPPAEPAPAPAPAPTPAPAPAPPPAAPPQPAQPGAYPPQQPPGAYPPQQPPGAYPPQQPPGTYPPQQQPGAYPPQQQPPPYGAAPPQPGLEDPSAYRHDGFYLRLAIGGSWFRDHVDVDYAGIEFTPTGFGVATEIALGGSPAPGFVIGGGVYGVTVFAPSVDELTDGGGSVDADVQWDPSSVSMVGPFVDLYPNSTGGFHLQGAIGYAMLTAGEGSGTYQYANTTTTEVTLDAESFSGFGLMFGVGFEGWIGRQWSMGGLLRLMYASVSNEADLPGEDLSVDWYNTVLAPSLLVTWTLH